MYLYPEKDEFRRMVRLLRQVWRLAQENLISTLKKIVDPTALSIIILIETKKIAKQVFYSAPEKWGGGSKKPKMIPTHTIVNYVLLKLF